MNISIADLKHLGPWANHHPRMLHRHWNPIPSGNYLTICSKLKHNSTRVWMAVHDT